MQSGAATEADTIREQLVWPYETSACQRHYRIRLLVHRSKGLHRTHTNVAGRRDWPMKLTYVCSEERTLVHCTVLA